MADISTLTIGCDLGDKFAHFCVLSEAGDVVEESRARTTRAGISRTLRSRSRSRVVIEVGPHSRWVSELVTQLGHEVIVANPRQLALIYGSQKKNDRVDAERLARLGRLDVSLLAPIKHRSRSAQLSLTKIRGRDQLVTVRTALVNHVRGVVKSYGERLPKGSTASFAKRALEHLPVELQSCLEPILKVLEEFDGLFQLFEERVATALNAERASLWLLDEGTGELRTRVANLPEARELRLAPGMGLAGHVRANGQAIRLENVSGDGRWDRGADRRTGYRTVSMLAAPVRVGDSILGVVQVLNKTAGAFDDADQAYLEVLADQIGRGLELAKFNTPQRGVNRRVQFDQVVGRSAVMRECYEKLEKAAATDATVLLEGETGTGKGLFARAIHVSSKRNAGPFVHIDLTAIPEALIESELFGHEQGAFTGAHARVKGKFEMASGGTLFLDEIDSLPLSLQAKLLRFLQERSFERVGGRETLTVDVRIVVATHRDLASRVAAGQFRSDLYYRIRVIDITLPTLVERGTQDIHALAEHFLSAFARRYDRSALSFSPEAVAAISRHTWPGNVRELEHAVERAVVLGHGALGVEDLGLHEDEPRVPSRKPPVGSVVLEPGLSLQQASLRYTRACLDRCQGNQSAASRELRIGRNRLARMLKA